MQLLHGITAICPPMGGGNGDRFTSIRGLIHASNSMMQTSWIDTSIVDYDSGCFVTVMPVNSSVGVRKPEHITFKPDLVLVRNQVRRAWGWRSF